MVLYTLVFIKELIYYNQPIGHITNKRIKISKIKDKRITVNTKATNLKEIESNLANISIKLGGEWSPTTCQARSRVALIVPYRNREANLHIFIRHMHPFLSKQLIDYAIYIVEPLANLTFNRGLLMNIGFLESLKVSNDHWQCFMFHDVDLVPEDERNIYSCPETPRHMSSTMSTFNYQLPYGAIFGGVSSLTKEQMKNVNGYSNLYFGWGGEGIENILAIGYWYTRAK
jgi:hypothetical protein